MTRYSYVPQGTLPYNIRNRFAVNPPVNQSVNPLVISPPTNVVAYNNYPAEHPSNFSLRTQGYGDVMR